MEVYRTAVSATKGFETIVTTVASLYLNGNTGGMDTVLRDYDIHLSVSSIECCESNQPIPGMLNFASAGKCRPLVPFLGAVNCLVL